MNSIHTTMMMMMMMMMIVEVKLYIYLYIVNLFVVACVTKQTGCFTCAERMWVSQAGRDSVASSAPSRRPSFVTGVDCC
jgi:hypothetical protein